MTKQLVDANFNQPVMSTEVVSRAVVHQILTQTSGQVILPPHLSGYGLLRALPSWLQELGRSKGSSALRKVRDTHPYSPN